jgi:hypothetical protein
VAKQFYLKHYLDSGETNLEKYHTHVTCPVFVGGYIPTPVLEDDVKGMAKCDWCENKDREKDKEVYVTKFDMKLTPDKFKSMVVDPDNLCPRHSKVKEGIRQLNKQIDSALFVKIRNVAGADVEGIDVCGISFAFIKKCVKKIDPKSGWEAFYFQDKFLMALGPVEIKNEQEDLGYTTYFTRQVSEVDPFL